VTLQSTLLRIADIGARRSEGPVSAHFVEKVGVDLTFVASLIVAAGLLLRPIPWAAGLEGALHAQIIS
jgi:hypothetical protein